jgi:hypothetical protein
MPQKLALQFTFLGCPKGDAVSQFVLPTALLCIDLRLTSWAFEPRKTP